MQPSHAIAHAHVDASTDSDANGCAVSIPDADAGADSAPADAVPYASPGCDAGRNVEHGGLLFSGLASVE